MIATFSSALIVFLLVFSVLSPSLMRRYGQRRLSASALIGLCRRTGQARETAGEAAPLNRLLLRVEASHRVVADQEEALAVGDHRRIARRSEAEHLLVGEDVDPDRIAGGEARRVDGVADHDRGPGDRPADVVL